MDQPWGRGTGEGIGLSGHKNEYTTGVRIGNCTASRSNHLVCYQ